MFPFLNRPDRSRENSDEGYSTEAVAVIATLVILAVGALALISEAVLGWAESISLG
ncbi:hypothetical protein [Nocardiopsis sp. FR4]|uniref:hypothetical protein n=1 Tax=Nocardiopsis sp. FR4 TaxID=2605985 RepID=UPI0019158456|nr:hypothetical protein [Nocardiopsis sp. FR4]